MRLLCAALLALALSACVTTGPEYIEIRPECEAPPQPALPEIDGVELAELSDDVYWRLEDRERRIVDWAMEMQAIIETVCEQPGEQD